MRIAANQYNGLERSLRHEEIMTEVVESCLHHDHNFHPPSSCDTGGCGMGSAHRAYIA